MEAAASNIFEDLLALPSNLCPESSSEDRSSRLTQSGDQSHDANKDVARETEGSKSKPHVKRKGDDNIHKV